MPSSAMDLAFYVDDTLLDLEEQKKAFHFANLQPLWATDNLRKGDGHRNYKVF